MCLSILNAKPPAVEHNDEVSNLESTSIEKTGQQLKTQLPFMPFCDQILDVLPPNLTLVKNFAEKSAIQSFTYDYKDNKAQFEQLEPCYTPSGWKSFQTALSKSGNLHAIKNEKLFVHATLDGNIEVLETEELGPRWKVLIPLKIRYENISHYFDQNLKVKLIIGINVKKLGVEQIIASPFLK